MAIDRGPWNALIDDDGSNEVGTLFGKEDIKTVILDPIDAALLGGGGVTTNVVTVTATGTVNNLACGPASLVTLIDCQNTAALTITGLAWTTAPRQGDTVVIQARNTGAVFLTQIDAASGHKFYNFIASGPTPLAPYSGRAVYVYQGTNSWWLQDHEQGAWITPAFAAGNFLGSGGMTWAVTAGQLQEYSYRVNGKTLFWNLIINGSTLSGSASNVVYFKLMSTYLPARGAFLPVILGNGGGSTTGMTQASLAVSPVAIYRSFLGEAYTIGSLSAYGAGFVEIQ